MPYTSYFLLGFLRQPSAAQARAYLGIGTSGSVITEADLSFSDIATANATAARHGLLPKLSGNAAQVLNGSGNWSVPAGSGDVTGPAGATNNNLALFNGVTGKIIQDGGLASTQIPSTGEKGALAGTSGAPSGANLYVTDADARNTNARTPSAHATSHSDGGSDPVSVLNLDGFPGGGTTFLRDDGTFAAAGGGSGTVTSVALTAPSIISVAGSPVTTAGTLALTLVNQNANLVFAGPATGAAAVPTFRALVAADVPFSADWTASVTKQADQSVVNSVVLVNDSELSVAVDANAFYLVEMILLYCGSDTTVDYKGSFTFPALASNTAVGFVAGFTGGGLAALVTPFAGASTTAWPTGDLNLGTATITDLFPSNIRFMIRTSASAGTLQFKFANVTAGVGRTSTTKAGSTLRIRKFS